jgi:hypothetical protein
MNHRLLSTVLLLSMLLSLTGSAWASRPEVIALLQVFVPDTGAMGRFAATGLPAYIFLDGFLLTGVSSSRQSLLEAAGLEYKLLDANMRGGRYYLATLRPNQTAPSWENYGRLLLTGDNYALLRSTAKAADRLAVVVLGMQLISLSPKPFPDRDAAADIFPEVVTPDPFVQQIIDQVTESEIYDLTAGLSGVNPVTIGGAPYTILTRYTGSGEPVQKATQYVGETLSGLGLTVEYHVWDSGKPPNVIGEIPGLVNPQDIYIIGGHLDDMPDDNPIAPGADDNASGSVATILAAKIFSQYYWGCTLRFALWTGEEQGLLGSKAYAQRSYNAGENILGYLNLDMIAWDDTGQPEIDLHANSDIPATLDLAQLFADVITAYSFKLIPEIIPAGTRSSDHSPFWDYNYVSILGIEDMSDFNDNYHTPDDTLDTLNLPYYTEFVKASLATFAHMSSCLLPAGSLDGLVSVEGSSETIPGASLIFTDTLGHSFDALTDSTGYYNSLLPAGVYTATVTAEGYLPVIITGITVVADTLVTQDFELSLAPESWLVYLPLSLRNDNK